MRSMPGRAPRRSRRASAAPARALPPIPDAPAPRRSRRAGAALSASLFLTLPLALVGVPAVSASTHSAAYARHAALPETTLTTAAFLAERSSLDPAVLSLITFGDDEVPRNVTAFAIPAPAGAASFVGTSRFVSPVPGPITSSFGARFHPILHYVRNHNGVDMTAACGTPVVAMTDGRVTRSGVAGGYGNLVEIDHGTIDEDRMVSRYAHLSVLGVRVGQQVSKGQQIGLSGTTGLSTGCHLHFEVLVNGSYVNPAAVLSGAPYVRLAIPMAVIEPAALPSAAPATTPGAEPTPDASASATPGPTPTPEAGPSASPSASAHPTASVTATPSATATPTPTASATASASASSTPTASATPATASPPASPTAQATASPEAAAAKATDTATAKPASTATASPSVQPATE